MICDRTELVLYKDYVTFQQNSRQAVKLDGLLNTITLKKRLMIIFCIILVSEVTKHLRP